MIQERMGLNWLGPANMAVGLGVLSQNLALALCRLGHELAFVITGEPGELDPALEPAFRSQVDVHRPTVRLGECDPAQIVQLFGGRRIAYTMFEVTPLPQPAVAALNTCDAVWAPTSWVASLFVESGVTPPLSIVPAGVDPQIFHPAVEPWSPVPKRRSFRFPSVGKWEGRKGFDVLLRAFAEAFPPDADVELVLHVGSRCPPWVSIPTALLDLNLPAHPPVAVSTEALPRSALPRLLRTANAFVLASRGEGFGMPALEAMACGVPVISTAVSGLADFCHGENSLVVECEGQRPVNDPVWGSHWPQGSAWYEPSIDSLAQQLQAAVSEPARTRALASRALRAC